ncbi:MAG: hypothetical protein F4Z65_05315 [Acidobacteria bacterium]|nr:hypothetical protein [Acidobacteriota bacterium]MYA46398.1 hypothetical protein [Acidobacteriota bacterium]MYI39320.1 hypothetical protein [Acidobacteriota bacterium]
MATLNAFVARYPEGTENRITWALMTLLRLVPMACVAFVDLVRACQERQGGVPIPALTAMTGCRTHIETQVSHLQARAGLLVAVGITREGGDVREKIEAEPRKAIYDGLITFEPADWGHGAIDSHEPVTLTVESKLDASVGPWQLMPSERHLPPPDERDGESPLRVDPKAVVLMWRDLFRAFTDLESRNLLHPSEAALVNDFLQYVRYRHPELNPFDRFALCRGDIGLLNRRCEEIMREVEPKEAWAGSSPIIKVESPAFQRIYLWAESEGNGDIRLGLWPGDTMTQARNLWPKVNAAKLKALERSEQWEVKPNLHFSKIQRHFHWAVSQLTVAEYAAYWKENHEQKIRSCYRDPSSGSFRHEWEGLFRRRLISADDVEELDQQTAPTNHDRISMSPGLSVLYTWSRSEAEKLDARGDFADEVRQRIREATETWGEVLPFCEPGGDRSNAPAIV